MKAAKAKLIPADEDDYAEHEITKLDTVQSPKKESMEGTSKEPEHEDLEDQRRSSQEEPFPVASIEYADDDNHEQLDLRISKGISANANGEDQFPQTEGYPEDGVYDRPMKKRLLKRKKTNPNLMCQYRELVLANGVIFKGLSSKKDALTGEGELHLTNGSVYKGQIFRGQPNGQGEMIWAPESQSDQIVNIGAQI